MDNATRLRFLQEMGIDVWTSRIPPVESREISEKEKTDMEEAEQRIDQTAVGADENDLDVRWGSLEKEVSSCRRCGLCRSRTQTVFGTGNKRAEWMFIGEAPGQSEDREGRPFVGRAGQLLTEMIRAMGLAREEVFIANILKCRPPDNRDPAPDEVDACGDFLRRQIELVNPKMILAVGRIAAQTLLKTDAPLGKLRGVVHFLEDRPVVVIYHPAYLLRSLTEKRKAWEDLQFALNFFRVEGNRYGN
ncbi:MAG: uracil-DNA glycosylase [Gammaproteobacteria bacterium]